MARYRVHIVPWLRRPAARLLIRDWLAITIGPHIFAWREMNASELAHELAHVQQWKRYGLLFGLRYVAASFSSWRAGTGFYHGNRFEAEAREAAQRAA
jgi:hypothetical protein